MSRYIAYEDLDYKGEGLVGQTNLYKRGVQFMLDRINSAPSIDIVRCRECKHWEKLLYDAPKEGWCNKHRTWFDVDDFCSYGKREGK